MSEPKNLIDTNDWARFLPAKPDRELLEELRRKVYSQINIFQDIYSWQPGESRNALVCEIRDKVDALFAKIL